MKIINSITILVILTGIFVCVYAQKKKYKNYKGIFTKAIRLYDLEEPSAQTDSLALVYFTSVAESATLDNDYKTAVDCFIKAGNIHQTYQRYTLSNQFYHKSLSVNTATLKNAQLTYEAYLYLGSSYYFSNVIDSAQFYFEAASSIELTYKTSTLPEVDRLYNSLGAIYFESANYLQAKKFFERSLQVISPSSDPDYMDLLIGNKSNIANCLLRLGQYDSALSVYHIIDTFTLQKDLDAIIKQNMAHAYFELGKYDSALAIYKKINFGTRTHRIKAFNDLGRIYMQKEEWQQAEAIFDSAIAINKQISVSIKNKDEALAYLYRGQLAQQQGLTDEALTWCNEALQEIHLNFKWEKVDDLPDSVSQTVSPIGLFEILQTKAALLHQKFNISGKHSFLTASLYTYRKALETANFIKLNFDNDEAKLFFNKNYQPIYNDAVAVAYEAYLLNKKHLDDYIYILENYKGNVVHQNLQAVELKAATNIPDSVLQKEKNLKQQVAFYISRINNNATEKDARQLQKRLLELEVELSRLQEQYDTDETYNFYKYQASQTNNSLSAIQSAIDDETALINYYVSDSAIYVIAINKNKAAAQKIIADSLFYKTIRSFYAEIYNHTEGKRYDGYSASAFLYNQLLQPISSIIFSCSKWVIVRDGILYYLPIETLVKNTRENEFVVQTKTVSYHYSFTLLLQSSFHHNKQKNSDATLAIAPFVSRDSNIFRSQLPDLPYSKEEIQSLGKNIFIANQATKDKFLQVAPKSSVIHLATHASVGNGNAANWIQFYPFDTSDINNKLFLQEIYNLDLDQTELVILSACETAAGTTTSGDGLLSLTRAFIYAGSDGIVSTLWKTEDKVTSYLMKQLHGYLKKNIPVEKALQQAKIDLLNNKEIGPQYKTPNYWGNFIYVGKIATGKAGISNYFWPILGIIAALSFVFFIVRYRKKKEMRDDLH